jgi:hypothetical protein
MFCNAFEHVGQVEFRIESLNFDAPSRLKIAAARSTQPHP